MYERRAGVSIWLILYFDTQNTLYTHIIKLLQGELSLARNVLLTP